MTAEKRIGLNPNEPQNPTQVLANNLVRSYKIHQELSALNVISSRVLFTKIEWGIDITPQIDQLYQEAKESNSVKERRFIYSDVASLQAEIGDLEGAEKSISLAERYADNAKFNSYLAVAKTRIKADRDPEKAFFQSEELVDNFDQVDRFVWKVGCDQPYHYLKLAKTKQDAGLNPQPLFTKAIGSARTREAGLIVDIYDSFKKGSYIRELLVGFAEIGYADFALSMVDLVDQYADPKHIEELKRSVYRSISEEQLNQGDLEGAITTAEKTGENDFLAKVLAKAALKKAGSGETPNAEISRILSLIEDPSVNPNAKVEIFTLLALTHFTQGANPLTWINMALEKIQDIQDVEQIEEKVEALMEIAKTQSSCGIDYANTVQTAIKAVAADKIADIKDMSTHLDYASALENLVKNLVLLGEEELALEQTDEYPVNYNFELGRMNRLLENAKQALKPEEISNLPPEEVQSIFSSGNQDAVKALEYFGII